MSQKLFNEKTLRVWQEIDRENWQSLAQDIANIFFETAPQQFKSLNAAWIKRNLTDVKALAHSLKSSCGNVGIEAAQNLFELIESSTGSGDEVQTKKLIDEANQIWDQGLSELSAFIKTNHAA